MSSHEDSEGITRPSLSDILQIEVIETERFTILHIIDEDRCVFIPRNREVEEKLNALRNFVGAKP